MKTNRLRIVLMGLTTAITVQASNGLAADNKVDWQTVDGGGGDCSGGVTAAGTAKFVLTSTVGQSGAGACAGGSFADQGGFLPAFQKDVGPPLSITRSMGHFTFTWPTTCMGFALEGARDVTGPWTALGNGMVSGGSYQFTLTPPTPYRFFRLKRDCPH